MPNDDASEPTSPFTGEQQSLLDGLLDEIIPAGDGGRPGAGQLGSGRRIAARVVDTPGLDHMLSAGLAKAAELLAARGAASFGELSAAERSELAKQLMHSDPGFFYSLQLLTYVAYYSDARVGPHLGLPDRPPQPLGHTVAPDHDLLELLAPVIARGKRYRDV